MKKTVKMLTAIVSVAAMMLSFASCTFFDSIREYSNTKLTIFDTPSDEKLAETYYEYINNSVNAAVSYKSSVSYNAGSIEITDAQGEKSDFMSAAASQLKTFVMSEKPGAESKTVSDKSIDGMLFASKLNSSDVLTYKTTRTMTSVDVTDEDEDNVTNESGENVTETFISDNALALEFRYFTSETEVNEEGKEKEIVTSVAANNIIESVFGSLKDKTAVIANFDSIKDYLVLNDYSIEYTKAYIGTSLDLEQKQLSSTKYVTEMLVTAKVTGVGSLAEYGEMTATFTLTKTVDYSFNYPTVEE